jgi:hypothetical protein
MFALAEARSGNTGLVNYNGDYRVLASGVDTLVLAVKAPPSDMIVDGLLDARALELSAAAGEEREARAVPCGVWFLGQELLLLPRGRKSWSVVLHNEYLDVQLGRGGVSNTYAMVRLGSMFLWSRPLGQAVYEVLAFLHDWLGSHCADAVQVSEVHLARDVAGRDVGADWAAIEADLVTRAKSEAFRLKYKRLQTIQLGGRGSMLSAVLYDKVAEIAVSHKEWLYSIWDGWDGAAPVWRLEFRARRDLLRQVSISTVDDLLERLAGLWTYCTEHWVRHVAVPDGSEDSNRWRLPMSSWWSSYASAFDADCDTTVAVREVTHAADANDLLAQAAGCMLGVGGILGITDTLELGNLVLSRFDDLVQRFGGVEFAHLVELRRLRYLAGG